MTSAQTMQIVILAGASNRSQAAAQARIAGCEKVLSSFDASTATVEDMREYSACVELIHPANDCSDAIVFGGFVFIVIAAIAALLSIRT